MPIIVQLGVMLARRKIKSKDLAEYVGITEANMSLLKQGKVRGMRFDTLEKICARLDCQPGDLLVYVKEEEAPGKGGEGAAEASAQANQPVNPVPGS